MDLNADMAEGFGVWKLGDDDALLDVITSANVACGFHGGDPATMRRVCATAAARGVAVGAQVSYRDLVGFGRRRIDYAFDELRDDVIYQIGALDAFCRVAGKAVRYVKPHGALYNVAAVDEAQAAAVVAAIRDYDRSLPLLCGPGSTLAEIAVGAGLSVIAEGFADRAYEPDGRLVSRSQPGAVVDDPDAVVHRALRLAREGTVTAVDGSVIPLRVASICLHSDTRGAADLARRIRDALTGAGIPLAPFAGQA
ncbi:LamB/YcsF family protein [Asanoa sp. WMMD1127]|uniref:LamB/YcsF family protein n=1 Tax=Asanoa sp. WMMD1127 TaxID=3016107 RepID=UPI002415EB2B|nr:5-oxoprolinase subunit PxpA [Asanoa sp. WMMD1127]MDG4822279.1 LamB/YcsF family protein [Asanoa sp. WMMD1127]